jgi:hypothetical protein
MWPWGKLVVQCKSMAVTYLTEYYTDPIWNHLVTGKVSRLWYNTHDTITSIQNTTGVLSLLGLITLEQTALRVASMSMTFSFHSESSTCHPIHPVL